MLVLNTTPSAAAMTMTSREIAELTGKRHSDVLRDIRSMFTALDLAERTFASGYLDANNQERIEFLLPYDETICLLTGYDAKARMVVIKRWKELEHSIVTSPPALPPMSISQKYTQLNAARELVMDAELKALFPLQWQQISDGVQNDIVAMFGGTPLLGHTAQAPLDIMEIAKRHGIDIPKNRKGVVGKAVKKLSSIPPVATERIINGAVRVSYAYTNVDEVAGIIRAQV
jgi:Phage regulatory protein Rha (Phage_pRha)